MRFFNILGSLVVFSSLIQAEEVSQSGNALKSSVGVDVSFGLNDFRAQRNEANGGIFGALNMGIPLRSLSDGLGLQLGGSYGVYDFWHNRTLQQGFVSGGLYRVTPKESGVNFGITSDWMFASNFGEGGFSPILSQLRAQLGYLFYKKNELGLWATTFTSTSRGNCYEYFYEYGWSRLITVRSRAIRQVNLYWTHYFTERSKLNLWVGLPYGSSLRYQHGRPGGVAAGIGFKVSLTEKLSLDGRMSYMTNFRSRSWNDMADMSLALTYSFGGEAAGSRPYMDLANNSNFLVDSGL